jgi:hypothetical protein
VSCGGNKEEETKSTEEAPSAVAGATYQPTGQEGTITGKVSFQGGAPEMRTISMEADPVCAAKHSGPVKAEAVVVNGNGTLKNVFVYVKRDTSSALANKSFAVSPDSAELDQDGCMYKPHVLGLQAQQSLRVLTKDNTTHNIHPIPKTNLEWNESQPPGSDPLIKSFSRPEVMIPVKCNQHPWMLAYIGVVDHPFYAVTGDDGAFTLKGLPPGDYEIEAYHEKLGSKTQKVTVGAKESKMVDFTFSADQAYHPGSLKMMPALVLPCCGEK